MADCARCGNKLGLLARLGNNLCKRCASELEAERSTARARYAEVVSNLAAGTVTPEAAVPALRETTALAEFNPRELAKLHRGALDSFVDRVLADDVLTEDEEKGFVAALEALGLTQEALNQEHRSLLHRLMVARVNAGRLPEISSSRLVPKRGEVVHIEMPAALMKEVTLREYQGGYGGVSFRVAKGVRFHTGGFRGKPVVVGTQMKVEDEGVLAISSKRAAFLGSRKTMDMPHSKLLSLNVFSDGIQFHMSNRQRAPLFKLESGELVGAVVNAAAQRL